MIDLQGRRRSIGTGAEAPVFLFACFRFKMRDRCMYEGVAWRNQSNAKLRFWGQGLRA